MKAFFILSLLFTSLILFSPAEGSVHDYAVEVTAEFSDNPPQIDFSWPEDVTATEYFVFKKLESDTDWWLPLVHLDGSATSYTDTDVDIGKIYEYSFRKNLGSIRDTIPVAMGIDLTFKIRDSWSDGICCHHGLGSYTVSGCDEIFATGGAFGVVDSTSFQTGSEGPCYEVVVAIDLDVWGMETSWTLTDDYNGDTLAQGNAYDSPHYGHILTGFDCPPIEDHGLLLLIVDQSIAPDLGYELSRLTLDLIGDGYRVHQLIVNQSTPVTDIKQMILNEYNLDSTLSTIFLFGHVPIPYSGNEKGVHTDHQGAWPADLYYGDLDGIWTDTYVNNTSASREANHNIPGDGKFDQTWLPSEVELMVGRVDLSDLPAFVETEVELLRRYLDKDHAFRTGETSAEPRGLIDDNVGEANGLAFAAFGWRNFAPMFGAENIFAGDFFPDLTTESYLWAYGCGGSGYSHCGGVGSTWDFATYTVNAVFTILYGSYFGDWDNTNNILRSPLAANGLPLVNFYAGRPTWNVHQMALGHTVGHVTRLNQNNNRLYTVADGGQQIHVALMGDPSLKMHIVKPVTNLRFRAITDSEVHLTWSPADDDIVGYNVYRTQSLSDQFTRLNLNTITDTTWIDSEPSSDSIYMVRAVKLETPRCGSYYNLSLGIIDSLAASDVTDPQPESQSQRLINQPNPFNKQTDIKFSLPDQSDVTLKIYDVTGKLINTIANTNLPAGQHFFTWNGKTNTDQPAPSGVYYYTLKTNQTTQSRQMIRLE